MLHTVAVRGAGGEARWSAVVARYLSRSARGAHSAALAQPGLRTCVAPALASATKRCPSQKCGTRVAKGTACIGGACAGSHEICPRGGARAARQQRRAAPHVRCCSAHPRIVATALEEQFQRGWSREFVTFPVSCGQLIDQLIVLGVGAYQIDRSRGGGLPQNK